MAETRVENISKAFEDTQAVKNLSFTVKHGEFVVLLGPTGAGKTTTLRLIAGLEKVDSGKVFIGNEDVTQYQPAQRDVAFVFQQYSLYPNYTVYKNLAFPLRSPLRSLSKKEIDETVRSVARTLHIEDKLSNKATHLSGGEMQRVAIGRALVRKPNIFLMDEPLSSLDAKLREELRLELKNIQVQLGATLLFVTHDHVEATTMADRIGIIKEGELIQIDTPENIYKNPNSVYVAYRLGSPKINILPTELLDISLPERAKFIGFRPEDVILEGEFHLSGEVDGMKEDQSMGFTPGTRDSDKGISLEGEIETIQNLGVEEVLSMKFKGEQLRAVTRPFGKYKPHEKTNFGVLWNHVLFFDQDSQRILD